MGEDMRDGTERRPGGGRGLPRKSSGNAKGDPGIRRGNERRGKRHHATEQPFCWPPHQQHLPVRFDPPRCRRPLRLSGFQRSTRIAGWIAASQGSASAGQRTHATFRIARHTDRRAQIHHGLREISAAPVRGYRSGEPLQFRLGRRQRRLHAEQSRHDALNIPIHDHRALPKGDRGDGSGGVRADAGQGLQPRFICGEAVRCQHARAGDEIAGARIIAEAGPGSHHLALLRQRQRIDCRPARREA